MKNISLLLFCFLFLSTFVLAQTYEGDGTYSIQIGGIYQLNDGYSIKINEYVSNYATEYYKVSLFSPEGDLIKNFTQGSVYEYSLRNEDLELIGTLKFTPSTRTSSGNSEVSIKSYSENDPVLYGTYTCLASDRTTSWKKECKSIKDILGECGSLEFMLTDVCGSTVSLTQSEEPDEQEEEENIYTQNTNNQDTEKTGFFKRSWTWFKCLFSRKC
jgi:hypothetical protein